MVASGARGARPERKTPASVLSASASVATVGKSREHEWAARARTHRVGRVAPCLWHRRLPPPHAEEACREMRGKAHAHLAPQRRELVGGALWQRAGGHRRAQVKGGTSCGSRPCALEGRRAAADSDTRTVVCSHGRARSSRS